MSRISMILTLLAALPLLALAAGSVDAATAAAHVIFSYKGTTPPAELMTLASKCQIGGIITFGENVDSNLPGYIKKLQSTYAAAGCAVKGPLLILTDQEGGEVRRLPGGPNQSEKQIGQAASPTSAAATAGTQAATALKSYNHNGNLAPVLDVYRVAGDFEDKDSRSYSNNASVVAKCGASFIKAQQAAGVIATVKHFPGLGAAAADENTDAKPVTINKTLTELRNVDEAPYVNAIAAGAKLVMPSWALYPALDTKFPSGISSKWVGGELRGRLGYKGVIITDAIEAGGLDHFGKDPGYRSVLALQAGVDVILAAARNATQGTAVVNALVAAVKNGTLDSAAFQASTDRIVALRKGL